MASPLSVQNRYAFNFNLPQLIRLSRDVTWFATGKPRVNPCVRHYHSPRLRRKLLSVQKRTHVSPRYLPGWCRALGSVANHINTEGSVYSKLPTASSIRIIGLLPGGKDDPLEVELHVTDLNDENRIRYDAISYAWGTTERTEPILCRSASGSATLWITKNLASVFRRLRERESEATFSLWADAVCIDQSDDGNALQERAQQVQMMNRIFPAAEYVYADLGEEPEHYELFDAALVEAMKFSNEDFGDIETGKSISPYVPAIGDAFKLLGSLGELLARPYFSRIWTLQEYVLASHPVFMVGLNMYNADWLTPGLQRLQRLILIALASTSLQDTADSVKAFRIWRDTNVAPLRLTSSHELRLLYLDGGLSNHTISELIVKTWEDKATDPRDRFYALYSLASDINQQQVQQVPIDYTRDIDALSLDVSKLILSDPRGVDDLFAVISGAESKLPSWSLNLRESYEVRKKKGLGAAAFLHRLVLFNACRDTKIDISLNEHDNVISLSACIVDSISRLGPTIPTPVTLETLDWKTEGLMQYRDAVRWNEEIIEWTEKALSRLKKDIVTEMRWRTLCADLAFKSAVWQRATPEGELCYEAYLESTSRVDQWSESDSSLWDPDTERARKSMEFALSMSYVSDQRIASTHLDRLALVPRDAVTGDEIAIIAGMSAPFVIRRQQDGTYKLVGECYLHGVMDGEAFEAEGFRLSTLRIS